MAQFLAAARRGVQWSNLVTELVGPDHRSDFEGAFKGHTQGNRRLAAELLDEIAWASLDGPAVAPWVVQSVRAAFQRGEPDAWERAFRYLERCLSDPGVLDVDPAEESRLVIACRSLTDGEFRWMWAGEMVGWVLLWAPLPGDAADSMAFVRELAERTGVLVTPGVSFGSFGEGHVRMALVQAEDRLAEAAKRIQTCGILEP